MEEIAAVSREWGALLGAGLALAIYLTMVWVMPLVTSIEARSMDLPSEIRFTGAYISRADPVPRCPPFSQRLYQRARYANYFWGL